MIRKTGHPEDYEFGIGELNGLGYSFLRLGKTREAIEVFRLNVEAYPKSWIVYDSLAEADLASGEKASAIENYRHSLELNPQNQGAQDALKRLGNPSLSIFKLFPRLPPIGLIGPRN